tara:strand:+ start:372 stop:902 length:531 start_codon:yes stop_codon:yes gene_type:complete
MVFDIDDIPDGGLDFEVAVEKDRFNINQRDCYLARNVEIQGGLTRRKREIFFKGRVKTRLLLECSRCLSALEFGIDANVYSRYVPKPKNEEFFGDHELNGQETETEYYLDNRIDLKNSVHDAILLDVPMFLLCREDCKGFCGKCGKSLNDEICECGKGGHSDPRFDILRQLKDKLK